MKMRRALSVLVLAGTLVPASARADHHGMVMEHGADPSAFGASVALLAASFDTMYYVGDYQGVLPSMSWTHDWFVGGASLPYYHIRTNGLENYGPGDLVLNGQARLFDRGEVQGGALFAVSFATGDPIAGLGMGHDMLMPAAWGSWHHEQLFVSASLGYSRAIVDDSQHHDHGMWPLVEPMNMSEITWSGAGELSLAPGLRAGARLSGGAPVGSLPGHDRIVGTLRVAYGEGRVDTAAELQAGLAGDPFTTRGIVSTSVRF
jgi:hypothetical protein